MNADWKSFLQKCGVEFDGRDRVASFGNPERELRVALSGAVFADLSHQGLLAVRGKDAQEFLQGQFTNDLRNLGENTSQLNGYCSAKGRLLATFRVIPDGDGYLLRMPRSMIDAVRKRLQMFVLRSAVTLEDASERYVRVGLSGPDAAEELAGLVGQVPAAVDQITRPNGFTVTRIPGLHPRFEIYGVYEDMRRLWETLNVRAAPVGESAWGLLEIMAGIPVIQPETMDAFVPQMVNMQLIGAVSFKKGCYPGQEVVARMQYLGKLKRRMYLAKIRTAAAPDPGMDVFAATDSEQSAGKVLDARPHPDGGFMALVVIQIASQEAGEIRLGAADGPVLDFVDLPYPIPATE